MLLIAACSMRQPEGQNTLSARSGQPGSTGPGGNPVVTPGVNASAETGFGEYWYAGKAELNIFDLKQARYGELRDGHAVLIFVTEDFSKSQLVKLDNPGAHPEDAVRVMKLNFTREFPTGVYAYRTMQSVFSPIDRSEYPSTLKITTGSQEWCGQVFMKVLLGETGYSAHVDSYFESESGTGLELGWAVPEDALWNLIRLDPAALPLGSFSAIPGNLDIRLRHLPLKAVPAEGKLEELENGERRYEVRYPTLSRTLRIWFEGDFPRSIVRWEEETTSRGQTLTTTGVRRKQVMLDYWAHNQLSDDVLRKELGLP